MGIEEKKPNELKRRLNSALKISKVTSNHFIVDKAFISSSGLVYTTLTALIPALTVFFTFFGALGVLTPFKNFVISSINEFSNNGVGNDIVNLISGYTQNATSLGIVGLVSFLVTMILLINRVWSVINGIYRTAMNRNIIKRFANFISFAIVSILLIAAFINVQSRLSERYIELMGLATISSTAKIVNQLLPFFIIWIAIFLLIFFVPNTKVEFSAASIGSTVGSIIVLLANEIFFNLSTFVVNLSIIYGSFAVFFLFLVWFYMLWVIILFSVELSYVYQFRPDLEKTEGLVQAPAKFISEGINIIMLIGDNFRQGKGSTDTREINERLAIPDKRLYGYLDFFVNLNYLIPTNNGRTAFIPSRPLSDIIIQNVVEGLYGLDKISYEDKDTAGEAVVIQIHGHGITSLGKLNLENLLERI
ncbi:MAG: YihY/virulence factor BrkB family protein [Spirochaetia bacterium]|nr:YihY/virulence factor BrkB family protein [Spirochaetia bacterium]